MSENGPVTGSNARSLKEQAIKWVVDRNVADDWSESDQHELDAWLNQSRANLVAYWRAEDNWNRTELLAALRHFRPNRAQSQPRLWTLWTRRVAVAAVIVILGVVATTYYSRPVERTYSTSLGGRKTLALADGSQIELNTDTVVSIAESGSARTARLEKGEAFFQIKHDSRHPFIVTAANHRIIDLGTKFSVRAEDDHVQVELVEGRAQIENLTDHGRGQTTILEPGDVAVATANSISLAQKTQPQLADELAWRRGVLVFENTPLNDVATEFNRYNERKIVIADRSVARLTIVGAFQANDLEAVTNIAREVFKLRVAKVNDQIVISR